jgi:tetratricopeptide (TPR) repeat protein
MGALNVTARAVAALLACAACAPACGKPGVAGMGEVPTDPAEALALGQPRTTLRILEMERGADEKVAAADEPVRALFAIASLDLERWGDAEAVWPKLADPARRGLVGCYLKGKRLDVDAERVCREALESPSADAVEPLVVDSGRLGLAQALERNHRMEAAEEVLKALVAARPNTRNRKAQYAFYDRVGWVNEGIAALDAWIRATPDDPSVRSQLVQALERKVRGDLLEGRGAEAEKAARRLLELEPTRGTWRYYLADALDLTDRKDEAAKERAAAKASGAAPPRAVNAVPGLDGEAPPLGGPIRPAP